MGKGFMVKHREPIVDTNVYYYNLGDECTALTGGWVEGFSEYTGSQSKQSTWLEQYAKVDLYGASRTYVTNNAVDLTNISTLNIEIEATSGSGGTNSWGGLQCSSSDKTGTSDVDAQAVAFSPPFTKKTLSVNTSALMGSYYLKVRVNTNSTIGNSITTKTTKVWGEV